MVDEMSKDYANYFYNINLEKELDPLSKSITEMLTRLDEFESYLTIVKNDSNQIIKENIPKILQFKPEFEKVCKKIDTLENFVNIVQNDLNKLEETVDIAQEELNVPDFSLKGLLLNSFLRKTIKPIEPVIKSNTDKNGDFIKPKLFEANKYFGPDKNKS